MKAEAGSDAANFGILFILDPSSLIFFVVEMLS